MFSKFSKLLFVVGVILSAGCNSGKQYTIKMRLHPGDQFTQNIQSNTTMYMSGEKRTMHTSLAITSLFEVLDSNATEYHLRLTHSRVKMLNDKEGLRDIQKKATDSLLEEQSKNMEGKSMILTLNKENKITDVSGFDSVFQTKQIPDKLKAMMKQMFSKEQVNNMFGFMFNMYPDKPVRIGDNWKRDLQMNLSGLSVVFRNTYTLLDIKNNIANIKVEGDISSNGKIANLPTVAKLKMEGSQTGNFNINLTTSYLENGKYNMNLGTKMEMRGKKFEMKTKSDYVINGG